MNSMHRRWQAIGVIRPKPPLHALTSCCSCWFTAFPANKWAPPAPVVPKQRCSGFLRSTPPRLNRQQHVGTLLNAVHPAECPDLLLDQSHAAEKVVAFLEENEVVILRGPPRCGKTWLVHAVVEAAKHRKDLWSSVDVVYPHDFVAHMKKLKQCELAPRPLIIVDEVDGALSEKAAKYIVKLSEYGDFLFLTRASQVVANQKRTSPVVLRGKHLWLSSVTTDPDLVKEWITRLVNRATTKRSKEAKARLIAHTFAICGGHVGRTVRFLAKVLKHDGIRVPRNVFDFEPSACGNRGSAWVFKGHPWAGEIFTNGSAKIDLGHLRDVSRLRRRSASAGHELMEWLRQSVFVPIGSWKVDSSLALIKGEETEWSMGSAAQRDYVTRRFSAATFKKAPRINSPVDVLLHTLPFWPTDLLFVRDEDVKRLPFLEKHVHHAFIVAHEQLCARCPPIDTRLVHENLAHPQSLDFVVHVDDGSRYGIEFLIDGSFAAHHERFKTDFAGLNLDDHLTVYFEADKNHTNAALKFVKKTPRTCVVQPCPVRGWDAFHVTFNDGDDARHTIVPRVGGASKMFGTTYFS